MPDVVEPPAYDGDTIVRKVTADAGFWFKNRVFACSKAFVGRRVALRPTDTDGVFDVCYRTHIIGSIDLNQPTKTVQDVSEHVSGMSRV